jgi:hypothetical protein
MSVPEFKKTLQESSTDNAQEEKREVFGRTNCLFSFDTARTLYQTKELWGYTQTHRQQGELIILLLFFNSKQGFEQDINQLKLSWLDYEESCSLECDTVQSGRS